MSCFGRQEERWLRSVSEAVSRSASLRLEDERRSWMVKAFVLQLEARADTVSRMWTKREEKRHMCALRRPRQRPAVATRGSDPRWRPAVVGEATVSVTCECTCMSCDVKIK